MGLLRITIAIFSMHAILFSGCGENPQANRPSQQTYERTPPPISNFLNGEFEVFAVVRDGELSTGAPELGGVFAFSPNDDHHVKFARSDGSETETGSFGYVNGRFNTIRIEFENGRVIQGRFSTHSKRNEDFANSTT